MTPLQALRANSLVGQNRSPASVLSPQQLEMADFISKHPQREWENRIGTEISTAWDLVKNSYKN